MTAVGAHNPYRFYLKQLWLKISSRFTWTCMIGSCPIISLFGKVGIQQSIACPKFASTRIKPKKYNISYFYNQSQGLVRAGWFRDSCHF